MFFGQVLRLMSHLKNTAMGGFTPCNAEQAHILSFFTKHHARPNVLVTGPGGTGKTVLIYMIVERLRALGKRVVITATTGIAAHAIEGRTLHSVAGIPRGVDSIKPGSKEWHKRVVWATHSKEGDPPHPLLGADTLIVDEVSMLTTHGIEFLSDVTKALRRNGAPFGGLRVIFVGDLLQLPPVEGETMLAHPRLRLLVPTVLQLQEPVRQKDPAFYQMLCRMRVGQLTEYDMDGLASHHERSAPYDTWKHRHGRSGTAVFPYKSSVEKHNTALQDALRAMGAATLTIPPVAITVADDAPTTTKPHRDAAVLSRRFGVDVSAYPAAAVALLKDIPTPGLIVEGAKGVWRANTDQEAGLCNGTTVEVVALEGGTLGVRWEGGGEAVPAPRHTVSQDGVTVEYTPLSPGWATTVHACQGRTLSGPCFLSPGECFEEGQAYVLFSRAKRLQDITLHTWEEGAVTCNRAVVAWYKRLVGVECSMPSFTPVGLPSGTKKRKS